MSTSEATQTSIPISGGITTGEPMDQAVDSSPFQEGERVLAFHGPCLYDAKVQKAEFQVDGWRYYVHYPGWNKHWDEWLVVDSLLKCTEENVQKQKELKGKHAGEKNVKTTSKKRKKEECGIGIPLEQLVNIQIPYTLKKQLVDDHQCITQLGQLVKLPRSPTVYDILNKYFEYRVKKDGVIDASVGDIVKCLRCFFDKALPAILLYKHERQQYKQVMTDDNISPSSVYGAQHLLRLFVKLPEMLSCMLIETETLTQLHHKLLDLLRFLQTNQTSFFQSNYQMSEDFAAAVKEEDMTK